MVHILNPLLQVVGLIDDYISLVWAERHNKAGDFELEIPTKYETVDYIALGNLLTIPDSETFMIIMGIEPVQTETGTKIVLRGESIESLLKQRYILQPYDVDGYAEQLMYAIIDENAVNPTNTKRTLDILGGTVAGSSLTPTYANQLEIQSVYDVCVKIAQATGLGFKVLQISSYPLSFVVYEGLDRSYLNSGVRPWVIFSENFDNVISGSYYISEIGKINAVQVITDDIVYPSVTVWAAGESEPEDDARYESVLETTIDRELDEGNPLSDAEVLAIIQTRGREVIYNNQPKGIFEGDFDILGNFKLGVDFNLGDIVQTKIVGFESPARVVEVVRSYAKDGIKTYVTMDFIDI